MRRTVAIGLVVVGLALVGLSVGSWIATDPDCPAQGAYGNYCGVEAFFWTLVAGIPGLILLGVGGWKLRRTPA